jgi:hypothetical protein
MPVIIREISIKVNVEEKKKDPPQRSSKIDRDALIDACVERVMEIMKLEDRR